MTSPLEILSRAFRPLAVPICAPRAANRAGVYLLIDLDEIVYVGSSSCVDHRLYAHVIEQRTRPSRRFDRALWIALPTVVHPDYEGAFIRALRPRDNYRCPKHRGNDEEILDGFGIRHLSKLDDSPISRRCPTLRPGVAAARITAARKRAGLSVQEFAGLLGLCRQAVHHWETGRCSPASERIAQIAAVLGCDAASLLPEIN